MLDPLSVAIAIYSFIFLKIRGQDRSVYFSTVSSADWPRGVDAWLSHPQRRSSLEASGDSSDDLEDGDEEERTPYVREKLRVK